MIDTYVFHSLHMTHVLTELRRWIPAAMSFAVRPPRLFDPDPGAKHARTQGSRLLLSIRALYTERQRVGNFSPVETGAELSFIHPRPSSVARPVDVEAPGSPIRSHTYPPYTAPNTRSPKSGTRKSIGCLSARPCGSPFLPTFCDPRREGEDIVMSRCMSDWLAEWDCR